MLHNVYKQPVECRKCQLEVFGLPKTETLLEQGASESAICPTLSLTPTLAIGATMNPELVYEDWLNRPIPIDPKKLKLPSSEEIKTSLWMPIENLSASRDYTSYECHDLRIAIRNEKDGGLLVAYCQRVEPNTDKISALYSQTNTQSETAPINDFNWAIGGRRMCPRPGTALEGNFTVYHSALLKAHLEAGVKPEDIKGMYNLGIGRTEFSREMEYIALDNLGLQPIAARRTASMINPQRTINRNFVILVDQVDFKTDSSLGNLRFLSEADFKKASIRKNFCNYEQKFLAALFKGWRINPDLRP